MSTEEEEDATIVFTDTGGEADVVVTVGHRPDTDLTLYIGASNPDGDCAWFARKEDWERMRDAVDAAFLREPRKDDFTDTSLDPEDDEDDLELDDDDEEEER